MSPRRPPFAFEGFNVRVDTIAGTPWFVLADVCRVLEIRNARDAAGRLDADEKDVVTTDTLGGRQTFTVINESGLYSLVLTSRKPSTHWFRKWITSEVIPSIRKTGGYHGVRDVRQLVLSLYGDKSKLINEGVSAGYRALFSVRFGRSFKLEASRDTVACLDPDEKNKFVIVEAIPRSGNPSAIVVNDSAQMLGVRPYGVPECLAQISERPI